MNKLPKVFANPINKNIKNEQNYYRSYKDDNSSGCVSIYDIDKILKSSRHIYRTKVRLNVNNSYVDKIIINRVRDYLLTIDNEKIPINNIKSIEEI